LHKKTKITSHIAKNLCSIIEVELM